MKMENQIFIYEGKSIRTVTKDGNVLWVAKDVCEALEIGNVTDALNRLDSDEFDSIEVTDSVGRNQLSKCVTESGLYSLILGSKKPEAKPFKRWVTHEILPTIRKHGAYMTDDVIEKTLTDPDFIIKLATQLKEERVKRIAAEKVNEENQPLVTFAETCLKSNDSILVRELSKVAQDQSINIGEKKLWAKLREWGLILKDGTEPSQYSMTLKLFEVDEKPISTPYGEKLVRQTRVLPKGQVYIVEKLKKELRNK